MNQQLNQLSQLSSLGGGAGGGYGAGVGVGMDMDLGLGGGPSLELHRQTWWDDLLGVYGGERDFAWVF